MEKRKTIVFGVAYLALSGVIGILTAPLGITLTAMLLGKGATSFGAATSVLQSDGMVAAWAAYLSHVLASSATRACLAA